MAVVFKGRRPEKDPLPPVPPFLADHAAKWRACERCDLRLIRSRVVLYRQMFGQVTDDVPCDLLFIGEGPGEAENALGEPFVGVAGNMLAVLTEDIPRIHPDLSVGISNVVGCFPHKKDELGRRQIVAPNATQCKACLPRLQELITLIRPRLIGTLGVPALKYAKVLKLDRDYPLIALAHPSSILRQEKSEQEIEIKRFIDKLYSFLQDNA